jgi:ribosome-binding ATPase YchF (GTP1/OBG family)
MKRFNSYSSHALLGFFLLAGSIPAAREKAQVRLEGKEYVVQEGDVILFRHGG